MISWQQDHRPARSAAETAAARQLAISKLTVAAQAARRTGQVQQVEDPEFKSSWDDDGWLWTTLAEQCKCDFAGPYGDFTSSPGHFLVTPRKEGPRPLWKNVIVYDTAVDGLELVRSTVEGWLDVRWCPKRVVERPNLDLLEVRLQTHETAHELVEAHGGLHLRAGALGEPSSRKDFFVGALFDPKLLRLRYEPDVPEQAGFAFL